MSVSNLQDVGQQRPIGQCRCAVAKLLSVCLESETTDARPAPIATRANTAAGMNFFMVASVTHEEKLICRKNVALSRSTRV
jgi:hypothetical protein